MFFPRLRRHAKWMFVFLAVVFGGGFVALRRRRRRHRRRRHPPRRRRLERPVRRSRAPGRRPRRTRRTSQAWRDLVDRAPDGGRDGRGDRGAQKHGHRARPEGHDALRELAGLYLAQATAQAAGRADRRRSAPRTGRRVRDFPAARVARRAQSLLDDPISSVVNDAGHAKDPDDALAAAQTGRGQAVDAYKKIVALAAERSERPARARAGRTAGRRRGDGDRRLHEIPEARARRSERVDRQAAAEAAEADAGRHVGIDSRSRGARDARARRRAGRRSPSPCSARVLVGLSRGCGDTVGYSEGTGDKTTGQGAVHREVRLAVTRSPTPARPGRSARTSTTPSSSRASDGLGESTIRPGRARSDRLPVVDPVDRRSPGMPATSSTGQDAEDVATLRRRGRRRRCRAAPTGSRTQRRRGAEAASIRTTSRRQGHLRRGGLRRLSHARRRRLERHRRPEPRRGEALQGARRRSA